jgi:hypothetical protein
MRKALCAMVLLIGTASIVHAEPTTLTDGQLDQLAAGAVGGPVGPAPVVPPIIVHSPPPPWRGPVDPLPPIIYKLPPGFNPGGPCLGSCGH